MKKIHSVTYDGQTIMVTDYETVWCYQANQNQLCDLLEYDYGMYVEKVSDEPVKEECVEVINGEPFYTWSQDELFLCLNTGQLVLVDTKPYYSDIDILKNLFNKLT